MMIMNEEVIYPSIVIRSQSEAIELLEKENKKLKEQLLVAQTNEETFRLEMEDITKTLGLDEDTIFDDVKAYARSLKDNWNKLKEKVNEGMIIYRNKNYDLVFDIEEIPKEDLNDFISYLAFQVMEQLIINLEQESGSNE